MIKFGLKIKFLKSYHLLTFKLPLPVRSKRAIITFLFIRIHKDLIRCDKANNYVGWCRVSTYFMHSHSVSAGGGVPTLAQDGWVSIARNSIWSKGNSLSSVKHIRRRLNTAMSIDEIICCVKLGLTFYKSSMLSFVFEGVTRNCK